MIGALLIWFDPHAGIDYLTKLMSLLLHLLPCAAVSRLQATPRPFVVLTLPLPREQQSRTLIKLIQPYWPYSLQKACRYRC